MSHEGLALRPESTKKHGSKCSDGSANDFELIDVDRGCRQGNQRSGRKATIDEVCTVGEEGYVVTVTDKEGYGDIKITVGITADGTINGIHSVYH